MFKDISGIIISGGKSSRMGRDKAFLKLGDKTIIERTLLLMKSLFENVCIVTNNFSDYRFLNVKLYEDVYKNKGPLSGIHSGLFHSGTEKNFIISCDLPLITAKMINYIIEYDSEKLLTYCSVSNFHHYLAGIYSKSLLPEIEKIFLLNKKLSIEKEREYSIKYLINKVDAEVINPEGLSFYSYDLFFNLNTPEDYEKLKKKLFHE